tara:strand:+ start:3498 stop:4118 length:621 start_codon:yes stop_codon:yes gene_type:complete
MDEITFIYNAWRTCLEMAEDRKYIINDSYKQLSINDFRYLLLNKDHSIDIICDENVADPSKILYIKFILGSRIKPSSIKEVFEEIQSKISKDKHLELTIILKTEPNNSILKLQRDKSFGDIQIMWCKKLQFNITKHELVPKHTKLSDQESKEIFERYSIKNPYQLPLLLKDDVVSKYYNFKPGNIIKIENTNTSQNSKYLFYRCVR